MVKLPRGTDPRRGCSTRNVTATVATAVPPVAGPGSILVTVPAKIVPAVRAIWPNVNWPNEDWPNEGPLPGLNPGPGRRLGGLWGNGVESGGWSDGGSHGVDWSVAVFVSAAGTCPHSKGLEPKVSQRVASRKPQLLPCMESPPWSGIVCSEEPGRNLGDGSSCKGGQAVTDVTH